MSTATATQGDEWLYARKTCDCNKDIHDSDWKTFYRDHRENKNPFHRNEENQLWLKNSRRHLSIPLEHHTWASHLSTRVPATKKTWLWSIRTYDRDNEKCIISGMERKKKNSWPVERLMSTILEEEAGIVCRRTSTGKSKSVIKILLTKWERHSQCDTVRHITGTEREKKE